MSNLMGNANTKRLGLSRFTLQPLKQCLSNRKYTEKQTCGTAYTIDWSNKRKRETQSVCLERICVKLLANKKYEGPCFT